MLPVSIDVVVVGAGNAALCAALAAVEQGASAIVLERAPEAECGGNTRFTAGAIRCVYDGVEDLRALMPDLTEDEIANTDSAPTPRRSSSTSWGASPSTARTHLCELLVTRSRETLRWI